jgi:hypothetical protein
MNINKTIAAGLIATAALTAAPASAGGFSFEFGSGGVEFGFPRHGHWDSWDRGHDRRGGWSRHDDRHDFLSPREVRRSLRDRGYRQIDYLDRQGAIYQAEATRDGHRYGIVVSARDGDILNRYRIRRHG